MRIGEYTENLVDARRLAELNAARLRELMIEEKFDAILVMAPDNWRYLTGLPVHHCLYFAFVNAALLHRDAPLPTLFAFDFYCAGMKYSAPWFEDFVELPMQGTREALQPMGINKWPQIIATKIRQLGLAGARIGADLGIPYGLKDGLQRELRGTEFLDCSEVLRKARQVKNEEEIKALRNACIIAEIAMEDAFRVIREGISELEIAAEVERSFRVHGAEYPVFPPLVMSGLHPLIGYTNPSSKTVRPGELVRLDIGCCYGGYNSCFARTVLVGSADQAVTEAYEAVQASLQAGVAAARPGFTNVKIHQILAETLRDQSKGKYSLGWYGGHGVGTGIHEDPMIGDAQSVEEITLEPGMCLAI